PTAIASRLTPTRVQRHGLYLVHDIFFTHQNLSEFSRLLKDQAHADSHFLRPVGLARPLL
ncbi:hypothetical protein, partial [Pseudomonas sp. SWRI99]|uniref:hypothetical protein n=1 Tax=Pseudomonas sp. SWRI99 TaxID=2745506 RepID=UPI001EE335E0